MARGWQAWSTQVVELHIFHADQENRWKEGKGFFKFNKLSITTIRMELANDYHSLSQPHSMEIQKLLEEFGDDQLQLVVELEAYEKE